MDIVDTDTRSQMMAGISYKDTRPELLVRRALHKRGFRFKLHDKELAGKPDLVFPKYQCVIFVQGCFWHVHDCHLFKWPKTREQFWHEKLGKNQLRDARNLSELKRSGWRTALVWECALRGISPEKKTHVIDQLNAWIINGGEFLSIEGNDLANADDMDTDSYDVDIFG
ncbi:MAG: DNA mismatch endonuclease Vsr [Gammaproteobacteria bacterium]|nr:DNA mismatch endonuclease Vsr [Gammaproteobacteria bacterium]